MLPLFLRQNYVYNYLGLLGLFHTTNHDGDLPQKMCIRRFVQKINAKLL